MLAVLVESAVRATLIAGGLALVLPAMRVRQMRLLHRAWTAVTITMLFLPVLLTWGPRTSLPILPAEAWQSKMLTRTAGDTIVPRQSAAEQAEPAIGAPRQAHLDWGAYAAALYFAGMGVLLIRLAIGTLRVKKLLREAVLDDCKLTHAACATPVTVGWLRPTVLLPVGWSRWPERQLRAIVAHEEEHVRRRDPLIQWIALLNRAVFWFHPLAWWLERELCQTV